MTYVLAQASAHRIPLRSESVQTCVTSPPYWGLRAYAGEQSFVWGGEPGHAHEWDGYEVRRQTGGTGASTLGAASGGHGISDAGILRSQERQQTRPDSAATCGCGAWYGALGLEPTPDLFVAHMVEVFREVRRVLRPDGTLWLNLGDSYSTGNSGQLRRDNSGGVVHAGGAQKFEQPSSTANPGRAPFDGLPPKNMIGIPWRVAFALQADGWYLRSDIVWSKPNPMPESVTDRPTKSHEYVFLLSKSDRYFYDADAIREPVQQSSLDRVAQNNGNPTFDGARARREAGHISGRDTMRPDQLVPENGRNARSVWNIATQPYPGAHFATFPESLPERCIKAGSARGDVILDPFNGSGTTGRVALRLGRRYVGLDLSREYLTEQALARVDPLAAAARAAKDGGQQVMAL